MGIIKKYKIIYERNIIISNLIFKANRGEKILYFLNSSRRKLCYCYVQGHANSLQVWEKKILNSLKKKGNRPSE